MTTLLLADHDNNDLADTTARALSAALAISDQVHILVAGYNCSAVAKSAATLNGSRKVIHVDDPGLANGLAEPLAALLASLAVEYDTIVAASTAVGKSALPRVAALLDVMQISDVIRVVSADTFERPTYAGNIIETIKTSDQKRILTVRSSAFHPVPTGGNAPIEQMPAPEFSGRTARFVSAEINRSSRPELTSAKIVIAGGRAFQSAEIFRRYLEPVADKLKAAIGASRAAVDAGYASNDQQVGQTGKTVAPDLYIACGISGAIQHLAGMKDARVIVAINKDPDAPIFAVADYGLVGDVFEILPELEKAL